jgi:cell division protein FtsN
MATGNKKKIELTIGKTGLIIVVTGMTALLCAAFLFGIDVGKNIDTYPEKIAGVPQRVLALVWRPARIRMAQSVADEKILQDPSSLNDENINLTFHNTLTSKKALPKEESLSPKETPVAQPVKEETPKSNSVQNSQKEQPITKIENNVKPAPPREEQGLKHSGENKFIVQVASLKEKNKAEAIRKDISMLGYKTEIVKADVKGKGIVFRIIATGFQSRLHAEDAVNIISVKTGKKCIIRKEDDSSNKH